MARFHREGYKLTEIIEIGVESFSGINDAALHGKVLEISGISHKAVGLTKVVVGYLKSQVLRVQQNRVKDAEGSSGIPALVIITNNRYPCQQ